jgi:hypothetical protein
MFLFSVHFVCRLNFIIYICSKLDMRLVVGGALLSVPNIVVEMEWREEGTLLTGLQLWPSYNGHDLGSF